MQVPSRTLRVASTIVQDRTLTCAYVDDAGRPYEVAFEFDQPIEAHIARYPARQMQQLLNYIALVQAMGVFNYGYFTTIVGLYDLTEKEASFFSNLYSAGLAEFRLRNDISLDTEVTFQGQAPLPASDARDTFSNLRGGLVGNGGGKDGAVAAEIAHQVLSDLTWFTLNKGGKRQAIIDASPLTEQISAERTIVPSIKEGIYKGHKPASSQIAFMAVLAALILGRKYVIVANEFSSNEGNFVRDGFTVNHQYSKTFAFEQAFSGLIEDLEVGIQYFSMVRPLHELQILRLFERYPAYHSLFVSCNHGVIQGQWCLECAKCAFLVLGITAIDPAWAERIWGDRQIIAAPALREHIAALISPDLDKPFECVGTLDECQLAIGMIKANQEFFASLPVDVQQLFDKHAPSNFETLYADIMLTFERENNIPRDIRPAVYDFFRKNLR